MEVKTIQCERCGGDCKTNRRATGVGQAILLLLLGVVMFVYVNWIVGVALAAAGVYYGARTESVLICRKCRSMFPRP